MDAIVVEHLTKTYQAIWPWQKSAKVLSDISFSVRQGEIFGFLGHNGAGKTTTMKILLGLLSPTGGRAEILGCPSSDVTVHARLGYLPETPYFYDYLTAEEFLCFYGRLARLSRKEAMKRVPELLERVDLGESRHKPLRKFSKGMLQRIGLAQALIHDPDVVILDEPMSGLDPIGRKEVRDLILSLRDQGKTVLFSSHIVSDVEMICDRVGILANGKMRALGRIQDLVKQRVAQSIEVVCDGVVGDSVPAIKKVATRILQRGDRCLVVLREHGHVEDVLSAMRQLGGKLVSVVPHKGSLEEILLEKPNQQV